jgi:hypothetical protein
MEHKVALIKDGYWQDTYWPSRYWQEDYWPEYGGIVGGDSAFYYYMRHPTRKPPKELLQKVKTLLEAIKGENIR